jgi:hypothetical protein
MSEETPRSLWDRVLRALDGWIGEDGGVDESTLAFHLVFIAPIFLALVLLARR